MGNLVEIKRNAGFRKSTHLQVIHANQHIRKSWVRQFSCGKSTMAIARQERVPMRVVENEIREALWGIGRAA